MLLVDSASTVNVSYVRLIKTLKGKTPFTMLLAVVKRFVWDHSRKDEGKEKKKNKEEQILPLQFCDSLVNVTLLLKPSLNFYLVQVLF